VKSITDITLLFSDRDSAKVGFSCLELRLLTNGQFSVDNLYGKKLLIMNYKYICSKAFTHQ